MEFLYYRSEAISWYIEVRRDQLAVVAFELLFILQP